MGLLDKAKQAAAQAEAKINQAASGVGGGQPMGGAQPVGGGEAAPAGGTPSEAWFTELGRWVYADRMERDPAAAGEVESHIERIKTWEDANHAQVKPPVSAPAAATPPSASGAPAPIPGTIANSPTGTPDTPGAPSAAPAAPGAPSAPVPPPPPASPPGPPAGTPGPPPGTPGPPP